MIKKLFTHSLIYGLAPQVSLVAGIFALPIITRYLTPVDFGIWGTVAAYVGGVEALATLGLRAYLTNTFFKMPVQYKWAWRQIYGFLILWSLPYALLLSTLLYFVIPEEAESHKSLLILLSVLPIVLFGPTSLIGIQYYQLSRKPVPIAIRAIFFGFLTIGLNLLTIAHFKMGYMGWAWTNFIVVTLMNASYWFVINVRLEYRPIFNFKQYRLKAAFKVSLPTIPHFYNSYLMNASDRVVMDQLQVPVDFIGQYNLANRFGGYFSAITTAINKAVGPLTFISYRNNKEIEARNLVFIFQIVILVLTFTYSLWSKEIFNLLIKNEDLKQVFPLSIIIVMAYNYRPMYVGAVNRIIYEEKTMSLWQISFVAGVLNVVLNFILIPIFSFKAAAYTTFASFMYMGFSGYFIKKLKRFQTVNYYPLFWFILMVSSTAFAYYGVYLDIPVKILVTLLVIGIAVNFGLRLNRFQQGI